MTSLSTKISSAILATGDIVRARAFYSDTLGLELEDDGTDVLVYKTGNTWLVVYPSEFAGTNKANAVVWGCGNDIEAIVADLRSRGVEFERYPDMDGMTYSNGIHRTGNFRAAWFKDPDGNLLHLNST